MYHIQRIRNIPQEFTYPGGILIGSFSGSPQIDQKRKKQQSTLYRTPRSSINIRPHRDAEQIAKR